MHAIFLHEDPMPRLADAAVEHLLDHYHIELSVEVARVGQDAAAHALARCLAMSGAHTRERFLLEQCGWSESSQEAALEHLDDFLCDEVVQALRELHPHRAAHWLTLRSCMPGCFVKVRLPDGSPGMGRVSHLLLQERMMVLRQLTDPHGEACAGLQVMLAPIPDVLPHPAPPLGRIRRRQA